MIPLMPSPGIPKTVSTPQFINVSTRISAAVSAISFAAPWFKSPALYAGSRSK